MPYVPKPYLGKNPRAKPPKVPRPPKPKRKRSKRPVKGKPPKGKSMTGYYKTWTSSSMNYIRTCSSPTVCRYDVPPYLKTTTTKRRQLSILVPSRNNKSSRPWSDFAYSRFRVFGGQRARDNKSWVTVYGLNDYGNWVPNQTVVYDAGRLTFDHPYAFTSFTERGSTLSESDGIAQAKLLSTLKENRTQMQLAVTLGEARETAAMIAGAARRLATSYFAFKKGKIKEAWRCLRGKDQIPVRHQQNFRALQKRAKRDGWVDEASSAWMEFNFGWKPVLGDIDSAAKYLAEKHVRGYFPVQEVSRAHRARDTTKVNYGTGTSYRSTDRGWYMCHTRYSYELSPDWARKPSTLNELGFTDPWTIAWELAPVSWLVDYVVNVGQVLESLHEFQQWRVVRGIKASRSTSQLSSEMIRNWSKANGAPVAAAVETYPSQYANLTWAKRVVLGSLPTSVPLRVKISNPFDLKNGQLASALIMMRYAFLQPRS